MCQFATKKAFPPFSSLVWRKVKRTASPERLYHLARNDVVFQHPAGDWAREGGRDLQPKNQSDPLELHQAACLLNISGIKSP